MKARYFLICHIALSAALTSCYRTKSGSIDGTETDTQTEPVQSFETETKPDIDTDTDVYTDINADADSDVDTDADADTDADSNMDADSSSDTDVDSDADGDADRDTASESDARIGSDTETDPAQEPIEDTQTDSLTSKDTDTVSGSDADTGTAEDTETLMDSTSTETSDTETNCLQGEIYIRLEEDLSALDNVTCIDGNLSIGYAAVKSVHLPLLTSISGNLLIGGLTETSSFSMENLTAVGNLNVERNSNIAIDLSRLAIASQVNLTLNGHDSDESTFDIDLRSLKEIETIQITGNTGRLFVRVDALTTLHGNLDMADNHGFDAIDLSAIEQVEGGISIAVSSTTRMLDFERLTSAGRISIVSNTDLEEIRLTNLETIYGDFTVAVNPALYRIDLGNLRSVVSGGFMITGNQALTTLDISSRMSVVRVFNITENRVFACDAESIENAVTAEDIVICGNEIGGTCGPDECPTVEPFLLSP